MSVSKKAPTYLKVSQVMFAYEHNILSVSIGVQLASTSEIVALHIQSVSNCVASYFVSEVLGLHIKSVSNAVASSFVSDVVPLHIQSVSNGARHKQRSKRSGLQHLRPDISREVNGAGYNISGQT
ncbi:hypothetical protein RRG08_009573 [Elysia crispata]|uniref:Uncharacterized protein n=1 Tax=Elysia crispata TaxID=231223 RepID=A0AAE1CEU4_9GAST|nr:hypothetical protein RRG08_009573 [Elysia crispata]